MTSYVIHKKNKNNEIVYMEYSLPGYTFNPNKRVSFLNVKNVKIVDAKMSDVILTIKFEEKFKKLLKVVNNYLQDEDAGDADTALVLDEASLVKSILLNRYEKFLNKEKEALFLKKLSLIENEIKIKDLKIKARDYESNDSKGKSR